MRAVRSAPFNVNLNGGALSGNGTVVATNVNNNAGQVNPGGLGAAGAIAITGNYTQGASGVLNIDIGGTGSDQFDRLTVSGAATLGGTISASLLNNFTPAAGNTFQDVIDFASKSGDFTTQNLSLGNNLSLQEQFDPSTNPVRLNLVVNQVNQAPTITTNPTNQTVTAGQTATFMAAASAATRHPHRAVADEHRWRSDVQRHCGRHHRHSQFHHDDRPERQ